MGAKESKCCSCARTTKGHLICLDRTCDTENDENAEHIEDAAVLKLVRSKERLDLVFEFSSAIVLDESSRTLTFSLAAGSLPTNSASYTSAVWIKPLSSDGLIFGWGDSGKAGTFRGLQMISPLHVGHMWGGDKYDPLNCRWHDPQFLFGLFDDPASSRHNGTLLTDGQWHHLAATYDGTTRRLFVDFKLLSEETLDKHLVEPAIMAGDTLVVGGKQFNGQLKELKVWKSALDIGTIKDMMLTSVADLPLPTEFVGLTGHWRQESGVTHLHACDGVCFESSGTCGKLMSFAGGTRAIWVNASQAGDTIRPALKDNYIQGLYEICEDGSLLEANSDVSDICNYWTPAPVGRDSLYRVEGPEARLAGRIGKLIATGSIVLVKGSYFLERWQQKSSFQMRQQIPDSACWNAEEALHLWRKFGRMFLVVISYGWLHPDHPDPDLFHLSRLAKIVEATTYRYAALGVSDIAVAIDFCSLWQGQRDDKQEEEFSEGLRGFNDMYIHQDVTSWCLTAMPEGEQRQYDDRGWTCAESALIAAKSGNSNRFLLDENFDPNLTHSDGWGLLRYFDSVSSLRTNVVPLTVEDFEVELEERRERAKRRGVDLFTNKKDNKLVPALYRESFQVFVRSRFQALGGRHWGCGEVQKLCHVLPLCRAQFLGLGGNPGVKDESTLELVCETLKNTQVKHLQIHSTGLKNLHAEIISKAIPELTALDFFFAKSNDWDERAKDQLRCTWKASGKNPKMLHLG